MRTISSCIRVCALLGFQPWAFHGRMTKHPSKMANIFFLQNHAGVCVTNRRWRKLISTTTRGASQLSFLTLNSHFCPNNHKKSFFKILEFGTHSPAANSHVRHASQDRHENLMTSQSRGEIPSFFQALSPDPFTATFDPRDLSDSFVNKWFVMLVKQTVLISENDNSCQHSECTRWLMASWVFFGTKQQARFRKLIPLRQLACSFVAWNTSCDISKIECFNVVRRHCVFFLFLQS